MAKDKGLTISALMIGPPRVGKSSVLASMLRSLARVYDETGVTFVPDKTTNLLMRDKLADLEKIYKLYGRDAEFMTQSGMEGSEAYAASTEERTSYRFGLNIQAVQKEEFQGHVCDVEFTDIRGEDLTEQQTDVVRRIQESSIIIVAIDSVALMEYDDYGGSHNDLLNYPAQIHKIVKKAYTQAEKHDPQLVLLVPLKCEKYYWQPGGMERVNARVKTAYKSLLTFLEANDTFSVAITPILTLGDVQFSRFADDGSYSPMYRFRTTDESGNAHTPVYSPKFCDQPLFYIAAYILTVMGLMNARMDVNGKGRKADAGKRKTKAELFKAIAPRVIAYAFGGVLGWGAYELIRKRLQKPETKFKLAELARKIKLEGDGYEMILDSLNMRVQIQEIYAQAKKNSTVNKGGK
ncbi:MAG: 50S ribosome-binding GTPase [Clostridia bacterium]|nr:50S ribosome-binding GTPase [Clostridia bacterium]